MFEFNPEDNSTSTISTTTPWYTSSLFVFGHQCRLLITFILLTMWFTNNQSKINFIRAKLSDEEVSNSTESRMSRSQLWNGLAFGSVLALVAVSAITYLFNDLLVLCVSITLQVCASNCHFPLLLTFTCLTPGHHFTHIVSGIDHSKTKDLSESKISSECPQASSDNLGHNVHDLH